MQQIRVTKREKEDLESVLAKHDQYLVNEHLGCIYELNTIH